MIRWTTSLKHIFFFPVLLVWFPLTLPLNDPYTAWFQSGCCASVPHSLSTQKVLAVKSEMENSQRWFIQVMMKHGADESLVYSTVLSCDIIAVLLTHWLFLTDLTQLQRVAFFFFFKEAQVFSFGLKCCQLGTLYNALQ